MWKWLSKLFGSQEADVSPPPTQAAGQPSTSNPPSPGVDSQVVIHSLGDGVLWLDGYPSELTIVQTYLDDTLERLERASQVVQRASARDQREHVPPVKLHSTNLLIASGREWPELAIEKWLSTRGWDPEQPVRVERTISRFPLEEGYFTCLRLTTDGSAAASVEDPRIQWQPVDPGRVAVAKRLSQFTKDEVGRIGECELFLRNAYARVPREQLGHPVFGLIDYPLFDVGSVLLGFAGSVWSEEELRFWSRPCLFHR